MTHVVANMLIALFALSCIAYAVDDAVAAPHAEADSSAPIEFVAV